MRKKNIYGLLCVVTLAFCLALAPIATAASAAAEEEVLKVMTNWFKAFNTNDYELMASLWWQSPKTSTFGPHKGDAFLTQGWELIGENWKSTFKKPSGTYVNSLHHPEVTMLGDNVAVITGYNTGIENPPAVKEQTILQVRGTFVVQKIDGKWLIVHEHSSVLPVE